MRSGQPLSPRQTPPQRSIFTPASDLYSLAATLHHAVTTSDPSDRVAFFYPPARRLNPAVTLEMETVLARELRLTPADRYPSAAAMEKDLAHLIASYPETGMEAVESISNQSLRALSPEQMRERQRSNNLLDLGVVASVVVLLLIAFLFFILR